MTNPKLIRHSPHKKNFSYHEQKATDLEEIVERISMIIVHFVKKAPYLAQR